MKDYDIPTPSHCRSFEEEGREAYYSMERIAAADNPYPKGTDAYSRWLDGYMSAQAEEN